MIKISASIVLYNTEKSLIDTVINSCIDSLAGVDLYLVDNSPGDELSYLVNDRRVNYLKSQENRGFGAGHNLAINEFKLLERYKYHIVINPDIKFGNKVISNIQGYMDSNDNVGVLMPKILNTNGTLQFARRLLPSLFDIFKKKFFPLLYSKKYEMINHEPSMPVEIIGLCGCFMFLRVEALKSIGLFDERYFMYFEDFDLCRRIATKYSSIYYPVTSVIHISNNEHNRSLKLFYYALRATILYFNKWGYFDEERSVINKKVYANIIKYDN